MSSYYFSTAINNGLNVLGNADFQHQILPFQARPIYLAKSIMTDNVTILFHTYDDHTPTLHLCDNHQNIITGADSILNAAPVFKGKQTIIGNTYTPPFTTTAYGLDSSLWNFNWTALSAYTIGFPWYYLQININGQILFSEPIYLQPSKYDVWQNQIGIPNTLMFSAQWFANKSQETNVVVSGWYNDYPTNTIPYNPVFYVRCEGYILEDDPLLIAIGYLRQQYEMNFITGQQVVRQVLKIGELGIGIPRYTQQMIAEMMISDRVCIHPDGLNYQYKIWAPDAQTTPTALWKSKNDDNYPLIYSTLPITLGSNAQLAMVTPSPTPPARIFTDVFDLTFS